MHVKELCRDVSYRIADDFCMLLKELMMSCLPLVLGFLIIVLSLFSYNKTQTFVPNMMS